MNNLTIIYYTRNREDENFEKKIRKKLLEVCGKIPIISVSHKPIKLGKNICIGEHEPSNAMIYRQLLIGCKEAATPFVINAEADFLYCPEYFSFVPPSKKKIYRYANIRFMYKYHWGFFRKLYSEGAQIAGRKYLIKLLEHQLQGASDKDMKFDPYRKEEIEMFGGENACVTFKTGNSLHKYAAAGSHSVPSLPYWGTAKNMRKKMFGQ